MKGFRGHKLKIKDPDPDGKYVGSCSCGQWVGFNKSKSRLIDAWNKNHINPIDKWK